MTLSSTDKKEIRKFGIIAFVFFGALCGFAFWKHKEIPVCFFGFLSLMGLAFLLMPKPLKPLYDRWIKITHFISKIVTGIFLTIAYYFVITPSGLIKRVFGGRPISIRPNKEASSYWVSRDESIQPIERYEKRY